MLAFGMGMVLRTILAAVVAAALASGVATAQDARKHFLWKVEGPGASVAYLLGSLHVLTPEFYPLSADINKAFAASRTLVEELDLDELNDPAQMMGALSKAMLSDGRTLDQIVAPSTFAEVSKRAEKAGLPMMALQRMKPWLVAITLMGPTLQAAGFKAELGVDKHFFDRAKEAGLKRQALETLSYQLDRFDQLSPRLQEDMLISSMKELDTQVGNVRELAQQWAAGDVKALEASLLVSFDGSRELYDRLLVERNHNWVPHVETCLQQNAGCFIVVGAAHLVGPDGVPTLLVAKGYRVTQQ
ncbi:MAG: TraB/GumN family protein [Acidobacteriota bacterium]|nr:TraB/GumN family protein [Acidobacteriota bacterium]